MEKKTLFLASSVELEEDRKAFEIRINRINKAWHDKGVFLDLVVWEDFLDAVSRTGLQQEYHKAIQSADIFVMLFHTRVGRYTAKEFETAFGQFKATGKPFIFTYFKTTGVTGDHIPPGDRKSLLWFQKKLSRLGHYYTRYKNVEDLQLQFSGQLEKLAAATFINFNHGTIVKEKNVVRKNLERVKQIHIGDTGPSPAEPYQKKNIVEGNVKDADTFTLGDGN